MLFLNDLPPPTTTTPTGKGMTSHAPHGPACAAALAAVRARQEQAVHVCVCDTHTVCMCACAQGVVRVETLEDATEHVPFVLQRVKPEYLVRALCARVRVCAACRCCEVSTSCGATLEVPQDLLRGTCKVAPLKHVPYQRPISRLTNTGTRLGLASVGDSLF